MINIESVTGNINAGLPIPVFWARDTPILAGMVPVIEEEPRDLGKEGT